ncbi:MAG: hypothetical protein ABI847_05775 [Anaerolineales bacterium]
MTERARRVNRWLIRICQALLVALAAQYIFVFISVPAFYRLAVTGQVPTLLIGTDVTLSQGLLAGEAARRGLPLPTYIVYFLVLNGVIAIGFWIAGAIVTLRSKDQWFPWFTALVLWFYPSGTLWLICRAAYPVPAAYFDVLALLWPCFPLFLFLFPDGRAAPRGARWLMAVFFVWHLAVQALGFLAGLPGHPITLPLGIETLGIVIVLVFPFVLFCQAYRYLRVADAVMRKQIQWLVLVLVLSVISTVVTSALGGAANSNDQGYWSDFDSLTGLLIPLVVVIAILRYHLWTIDVIIRRTLIYSVLTGLLALAYLGSVLLLQNIFQALTGGAQDQLVAVISTLAIAALFVPLRSRVQGLIDHRFYRRKYDAAKTIAQFGGAIRDEVELNQLTDRLIDTVDSTMQPASVGLWVKPDAGRGSRETA